MPKKSGKGVVTMKTAIIGPGNIGSRLALNLMAGGEDVIIFEIHLAKAEQLPKSLAPRPYQSRTRGALQMSSFLQSGLMRSRTLSLHTATASPERSSSIRPIR
jgi:3-hydroxyacyl-CoA dehydrogenase